MFKRSRGLSRRSFVLGGALLSLQLAGCATASSSFESADGVDEVVDGKQRILVDGHNPQDVGSLVINQNAWQHNEDDDVYYQLGVPYCTKPHATSVETMAIYASGALLYDGSDESDESDGSDAGDDKSTVAVGSAKPSDAQAPNGDLAPNGGSEPSADDDGGPGARANNGAGNGPGQGEGQDVAGAQDAIDSDAHASSSAPIILLAGMPDKDTFDEVASPTEYDISSIRGFLEAGCVVVRPGLRGAAGGTNDDGSTYVGGIPWGVTDLKAVVRCLRYNEGAMPGNKNRIFVLGSRAGAARAALLGASGDSDYFVPYLESIGAAINSDRGNPLSDYVNGCACWSPTPTFALADGAYEWFVGQHVDDGDRAKGTFGAALSRDLASSYANWINETGFLDENSSLLELAANEDDRWIEGSYHEHVRGVLEDALATFLSTASFPYTTSAFPTVEQTKTTYATLDEYLEALNAGDTIATYSKSSKTATIEDLGAFAHAIVRDVSGVPAFDASDTSGTTNALYATSDKDAAHFDPIVAGLLKRNADEYAKLDGYDAKLTDEYASDLALVDSLGIASFVRRSMADPLFFLVGDIGSGDDSDVSDGTSATASTSSAASTSDQTYSSNVSRYWRIRTNIGQSTLPLVCEMNLALALASNATVQDVDFKGIWGPSAAMAESAAGDNSAAMDAALAWVRDVNNQMYGRAESGPAGLFDETHDI